MKIFTVGIRHDSYTTMEVRAMNQDEAVIITEAAIRDGVLPIGTIVDTHGKYGCVSVDIGRKAE